MATRFGSPVHPSGGTRFGDPEFTALLPVFAAGPSVDWTLNTATGFTIAATANKDCTASLVVTDSAASQPSDATFDASTDTAAAVAATPFTIARTGESGARLRKAWLQLKDASGNRVTGSAVVLLPNTGYAMALLTSVNPDPALRLTAVADLEAGMFVQWKLLTGTGSVIVYDDASFAAQSTVETFGAMAGTLVDGWGGQGVQTVTPEGTVLGATESVQDNVTSAGALAQTHLLGASSSAEDNAASAGALVQTHLLGASGSMQDNVVPSAALSQTHQLGASSSAQDNAASSGPAVLPPAPPPTRHIGVRSPVRDTVRDIAYAGVV